MQKVQNAQLVHYSVLLLMNFSHAVVNLLNPASYVAISTYCVSTSANVHLLQMGNN